MATTNKFAIAGTAVTLLTTELNSLATGTGAVSSVGGSSGVFNSVAGGGTSNLDGYLQGRYELVLANASTISVAGAINVWFLRSIDGSNFEDGSSSVFPKRSPDLTFFPNGVTTAQRLVVDAPLPPGNFKVLLLPLNLGSGAQFASSGNTLKVLAQTSQAV